MSFKVEGHTTLVCDPQIIKKVAEEATQKDGSKLFGWTVEEKAKIRSHDVEADRVFDLVLRNPSKQGRCYDVGISYGEDGKTAEFIYDRWDTTIEEQLGDKCGKFKNHCAVATMHENDAEFDHMSYEEYYSEFCSEEEDGSIVYNGYDDEPWED